MPSPEINSNRAAVGTPVADGSIPVTESPECDVASLYGLYGVSDVDSIYTLYGASEVGSPLPPQSNVVTPLEQVNTAMGAVNSERAADWYVDLRPYLFSTTKGFC